MTEIYSRQGYERVELDSPQRRREFEKKTGLVQEVGSFDINTGSAERSLTVGVSDAPMPKGLDAGVSE
jgi:hypothetical protein